MLLWHLFVPFARIADSVLTLILAPLYLLTKQLGRVLSLSTSLHHAPFLSDIEGDNIEGHHHDNVPPEVALVGTAIIVLKLVYGLDGNMRQVIIALNSVVILIRVLGFPQTQRRLRALSLI